MTRAGSPLRAETYRLAKAGLRRRLMVGRGRLTATFRPRGLAEPPVFLVGCPRSGTTLLFELLGAHPDLRSLPEEGHVYWSGYNHPRRHGWASDALSAADASAAEHRYLETLLAGLGPGRPLDKTPKNVLRLPYLRAHFPDARIVLVVRDGRATTASLLEGWRHRRGASYVLPERLRLADYDSRVWRYVLPPGWRSLQGSDLAQVAARQYVACTQAADRHRDAVDLVVRYEDLVARPEQTVAQVEDVLGLPPSEAVRRAAATVPGTPRGAITAPRPDKWRAAAGDLERHLPGIEQAMATWGYAGG